MATSAKPKYDAFISYSHSDRVKLASRLQRTLETYAKPWYRWTVSKIFRDETNLSATPDLWDGIAEHLLSSSNLVVLCNPEGAASKWVAREIQCWVEQHSPDRLYLVLTAGNIIWDEEQNDFDWSKSDSVSPALSKLFNGEPLWVDLRSVNERTSKNEFDLKCAPLAAAIRGVGLDTLVSENRRQFRNNLRLAGVVALLVLVLSGFGIWQFQESIQKQYRLALEQSNASAGEALRKADEHYSADALAFARNALPPDGIDAGTFHRNAILSAVGAMTSLVKRQPRGMDSHIRSADFSPDGSQLVTGHRDGFVRIWDSATGALLSARKLHQRIANAVAFVDNNVVASGGFEKQLNVWNLVTDTIEISDHLTGNILDIRVTAKELAARTSADRIEFFDRATATVRSYAIGAADLFALDPSGDRIAVLYGSEISIFRVGSEKPYCSASTPDQDISDLTFSPGGGYLGLMTETGEIFRGKFETDHACPHFIKASLPEMPPERPYGDAYCGLGDVSRTATAWIPESTSIVRATKQNWRMQELDCLSVGDWVEDMVLERTPAITDVNKIVKIVSSRSGEVFGFPGTHPGGYYLTSLFAQPREIQMDYSEPTGAIGVHRKSQQWAILSREGQIRLRRADRAELSEVLPEYDGSLRYPSISFSPSGELLAATGAKSIRLLSTDELSHVAHFDRPAWDDDPDINVLLSHVQEQAPNIELAEARQLITATVASLRAKTDGSLRCAVADRPKYIDSSTGYELQFELVRPRQGGIFLIDCETDIELGQWPVSNADDAVIAPSGDAILFLKYGKVWSFDLPFRFEDEHMARRLLVGLNNLPEDIRH